MAVVDPLIIIGQKNYDCFINNVFEVEIIKKDNHSIINTFDQSFLAQNYIQTVNIYESRFATTVKQKFNTLLKLVDICIITQGTKPFQKGKGKPQQTQQILDEKPFVQKYKKDETFRPLLRGSLIDISIIESKSYSLCLIKLSVKHSYTVQVPTFLAEIELATQNRH